MNAASFQWSRLVAGIAGVLLVAMLLVALPMYRTARQAAADSAHAALTAEICAHLAAVPAGGRYPDSLSELKLTYPDGGSATLLKRFRYHSSGTNCTLSTRLGNRQITLKYP